VGVRERLEVEPVERPVARALHLTQPLERADADALAAPVDLECVLGLNRTSPATSASISSSGWKWSGGRTSLIGARGVAALADRRVVVGISCSDAALGPSDR
jgi:hypothetical protein